MHQNQTCGPSNGLKLPLNAPPRTILIKAEKKHGKVGHKYLGKNTLPRAIYKFLALGANFCLEWAQTPAAQGARKDRQEIGQRPEIIPNINKNQKSFLEKHRITAPLFFELDGLFEFLAETTESPVEQLWDNFWNLSDI